MTGRDDDIEMPASSDTNNLHIVMAASEAVPYAKTGGLADVVAAAAPDRQLGDQERQADAECAGEIDEQERAAAVLAGHVRKAPDVADADREADRRQQESESRRPLLRGLRASRHPLDLGHSLEPLYLEAGRQVSRELSLAEPVVHLLRELSALAASGYRFRPSEVQTAIRVVRKPRTSCTSSRSTSR